VTFEKQGVSLEQGTALRCALCWDGILLALERRGLVLAPLLLCLLRLAGSHLPDLSGTYCAG